RAHQGLARGCDHATTRARRRIRVALCEAQQCKPRLRFEAAPARFSVSAVGEIELTAQPMNLRLLIVGSPRGLALDAADAAFDCAPSLVDGFGPRAAQLHHLGAMDETVPGEHAELRMRSAPARERRRPFTHSIECEHPMTA